MISVGPRSPVPKPMLSYTDWRRQEVRRELWRVGLRVVNTTVIGALVIAALVHDLAGDTAKAALDMSIATFLTVLELKRR